MDLLSFAAETGVIDPWIDPRPCSHRKIVARDASKVGSRATGVDTLSVGMTFPRP